jgi:galactose-1-phosphate uridylyltransferase
MNTDELEKKYRELYWRKNEFEIIGSDAPDQEALQAEIAGMEGKMAEIVKQLGYTPEG